MNEPANFGTNEEKPWNWPEDSAEEPWSLKCPTSQLDDPPYKPSENQALKETDFIHNEIFFSLFLLKI